MRRRPRRFPRRPTAHLPGTFEKVEVIRQRLERGEHLWHPLDAGMDCFAIVRVPTLADGNHKLAGWTVVTEHAFREAETAADAAEEEDLAASSAA